jgi:hypothetical protein
MRVEAMGGLLVCLLVCGCAITPGNEAGPAATIVEPGGAAQTFDMRDMTEYMRKISARDPAVLHAETKRLQALPNRTAAERLELAWLLDREDASNEELARAQTLLTGLETAFADPSLNAYIRLMQRAVDQELLLRQEHSRADELQDKIDRLKDLEQSLLDRSQPKPPPKR